jgi:hypothetical protein
VAKRGAGVVYGAVYGLNHIRRAMAAAEGPEGYVPTKGELADVFAHVWAAVAFSDSWPSDLRADLAGLIVSSRRYGSCADTAHRMSPTEVVEFLADLRRLAARAARVSPETAPAERRAVQPRPPTTTETREVTSST